MEVDGMFARLRAVLCVALLVSGSTGAGVASASDRLCDPSHEDCRAPLLDLIRNERVGIDVAFWFMRDGRYTHELIQRFRAGVPIRVLVDPRANASVPDNAQRLRELKDAGIPMRFRRAGGILHWKMMLFAGQSTVQFSAANYSAFAFVHTGEPYTNYIAEAIYFTADPSVVNSFKTKFDDSWVDTTSFANYANISRAPVRHYPIFSKDPELNFPPQESFVSRAVRHYNGETARIDAIIYRITDQRHTDALIAAVRRGVELRIITEPEQYRDPTRLWHSWNVDRLHMAGARIRHRAHAGLTHQKSAVFLAQGLTMFGSSNWTSPSTASQQEHNYFTRKPYFFNWFRDQFERMWNNRTGVTETQPFVPQPPDRPRLIDPSGGSAWNPADVRFTWYGGPFAHVYDLYLGTSPDPPLYAANLELGPSRTVSENQRHTVSGLAGGTTYYWRVIGKTIAGQAASSAVATFTTSGTGGNTPRPEIVATWPVDGATPGGDAVLWAHLRNNSGLPLPSNARLWFYVTGPGWTGPWVGSVSAAGLAHGATRWYRFPWRIPGGATPGSYSYWAILWTDRAASDWSPQQPFQITRAAAEVRRLWPVASARRGTAATLWAEVRNAGRVTLPDAAQVWFYVRASDGSDRWVGPTPAAGLAPSQTRWYAFSWQIPSNLPGGRYTYWAIAWIRDGGAISPWSTGQAFDVP
jgi:phosphatidylserine/phosphatidylglycerophosphate/cardiolipin synthase-like enzyme